MTDFFYYDFPNELDCRARKVRADEYWVKDPSSSSFVPLVPGGGGGDAGLPYYLKPNSIDIDQGDAGVELGATSLTFGDSAGNSVLDKAKVDILTDLKTAKDKSYTMLTTGLASPVSYKPSTGTFETNNAIFLYNPPNPVVNNTMSVSGYAVRAPGYTTTLYVNGSRCVYSDNGITHRIDTIVDSIPGKTGLLIGEGLNKKTLTIDDITVTNQLKALTVATPGVNSKMLIYDTTTQAFNHADIPAGSTGYAYNKANGIDLSVSTFSEGIRVMSTTGIQTVIDGHSISMNDMFGEGGYPTIDFEKFKQLANQSAKTTKSYVIDLATAKTLKFTAPSTYTIGSQAGLTTITGIKAGDKYFFKNNAGFTFDPTVWYALPFGNVHLTPNTKFKVTLYRDISETAKGAGTYDLLWNTYDYNKDTAQVRYCGTGIGSLPVNTLLLNVKIGAGNPAWSEKDVFCIELVEFPTLVPL